MFDKLFKWKRSLGAAVITRELIANTYLNGTGIEIGALHNPLKVPGHAKVKYVDRMPVEDLRKQYPELNNKNLVNVDVVDDGEKLASFKDQSEDFVIANHFIEHSQNPIDAVNNMLRVVKPTGVLYLAVPDKRYSFDIDRPVTSFEHIVKDYEEGPGWSRMEHFKEWARLVNKVDESEVEKQVAKLMAIDYSIHYHVFTQAEITDFFSKIRNVLKYNFEYELILKYGTEVIVVLRKII